MPCIEITPAVGDKIIVTFIMDEANRGKKVKLVGECVTVLGQSATFLFRATPIQLATHVRFERLQWRDNKFWDIIGGLDPHAEEDEEETARRVEQEAEGGDLDKQPAETTTG